MTKLSRDIAGSCLAPNGSVVAIGAFDGLHRGHQALFAQVQRRARSLGCAAAVVTFEPLPRTYFSAEPLPRLSSVREKLLGFAAAGFEQVHMLRFNAELAAMSARDFVQRILVERLAAKEVWVGADFRFGHKRRGDLALLRELGFVTQSEFEELELRVAQLEHRIRLLERTTAPVTLEGDGPAGHAEPQPPI